MEPLLTQSTAYRSHRIVCLSLRVNILPDFAGLRMGAEKSVLLEWAAPACRFSAKIIPRALHVRRHSHCGPRCGPSHYLEIQVFNFYQLIRLTGGQRGIRTLETVPRLHTFQACAFDHSATCPLGVFSRNGGLPARGAAGNSCGPRGARHSCSGAPKCR